MKKLWGLVGLVLLLISLVIAGCAPALPGPVGPPPVVPCSLQLFSRNVWVYGTVYINAQPVGYLTAMSALTIPNMPCGGIVNLYIIDEDGFISATRSIQLNPSGPTVLDLTEWPGLF